MLTSEDNKALNMSPMPSTKINRGMTNSGEKKKKIEKEKQAARAMSRSNSNRGRIKCIQVSEFPTITSDALSTCGKPGIRKWARVIKDNWQIGASLAGKGEKD